jgi:hypothetical protein
MVYLPKTEAGKTIDALTEQLNSAQFQWNTYAAQLGRGYTTAYKGIVTSSKKRLSRRVLPTH